ncbi:MAG: ABC transporter permease [Burkholderiales bacterium]|nr:ABC transporter permease [Burkholderiales bacterium]
MRGLLPLVFLAVIWGAVAQEREDLGGCGTPQPAPGRYGPYDYRHDKDKLPIVENAHFTPQVEGLIKGITAPLGGDISYTLERFPNHTRALVSMMRLAEREKKSKPTGSGRTIDCYFERAVRFRPDDGMVRMIFATFLGKKGDRKGALEQLKVAEASGIASPVFQYNLGLAYFEVGEFDKALASAHRAYLGGFNLPGLKGKLTAAGKWREPAPAAAPPSTSETSRGSEEPAKPQ